MPSFISDVSVMFDYNQALTVQATFVCTDSESYSQLITVLRRWDQSSMLPKAQTDEQHRCAYCGVKNEPGAVYCRGCGAPQ